MKLNKFLFTLILPALFIGFSSCSDDDDPVNLNLEKSEIEVAVGASTTVKITEGNGKYEVTSASKDIATTEVADNTITVTGVAAGETTITVKDKESKTATLKVKVTGYAASVEGTYNGDFSIKIDDEDAVPANDQDIKIVKTAENTVKLLLENFSFGVLEVGDIIIEGITLSKDGSVIKLSDTSADVTLAEGTMSAKVAVASSTIGEDGKIKLNINVTEVKLGQNPMPIEKIAITFDGDKTISE